MSIHPVVKKKDDDHGKTARPRMPPEAAEDDVEEIHKLDVAVSRLFQAVPEHPYILSVPCSEPRYHYPSRQEAESWAKHTPFSLDEERLQYMTFLYRDPSESTFVVRSQVDEERDRLAHLRMTNGISSSATTPLKQSVAKKKISLSAYKDKLAGKATSPEKVNGKMDTKDVKPVNGMTLGSKHVKVDKSAQSSHGSAVTGQKRPRDDYDTSRSSIETKAEAAPSVKKPRPSTQSLHTSHVSGPPHDLPPLLSPTFPSSSTWDLPPMLSPTLPPKIEAELEKEAKSRSRAESNTSSSSNDKRLKSSVGSADTSTKSTPPAREREQPSAKIPSKTAPTSSHTQKEAPSRSEFPARKASDETKVKKIGADEAERFARIADLVESDDEDERPKPRQKLIVRLKYGKKNKMQIERYLRLPPKPARDQTKPKPSQPSNVERSDTDRARAKSRDRQEVPNKSRDLIVARETAKKTVPTSDRSTKQSTTPGKIEKRSRLEDNDAAPAAKRQKIPSSLDVEKNPQTPNRAPLISPSFQKSGGSMKSGAHLTPRADHLRSTAMSRSGSSESVTTPAGKRSYPTPLPRTGEKGPTSTPTSGRAADYQALLGLSKQFNELGRKLKHSNQAAMAKPKDQITEGDRKRAACLGLECILSYMLAYGLVDAGRKIDRRSSEIDTTWLTLLPLFKHLGGSTKAFAPLEGLRLHLGVTITARIQSVLADRIGRANSASLTAQTPASQEGRDKSDSPHDPFTNTPGSAKDQTMLAENYTQLGKIVREARSKLPVREIISAFPKTWERSAIGAMEGEETLLRDGAAYCKGKFWLPVSIDTTPVQAVRFGLFALDEWVRREGLEYEVQVKL